MINKVVKHILEAKIQDLPFAVLKDAVDFKITPKDLLNYCNDIYDEKLDTFELSTARNTRPEIYPDKLHFFPEGVKGFVKDLAKLYGNPQDYYFSIMQTAELSKNKVHASLHNDRSDVVHLNCFGRVEWTLMDPKDMTKTEYKVTLEPGDLLYMRGWTLHETVPLTPRGSIIFMNLPYEKGEWMDEEALKQQRIEILNQYEIGEGEPVV